MSRRSKAGRPPTRLKAPRSPEILGKSHGHKSKRDYKRLRICEPCFDDGGSTESDDILQTSERSEELGDQPRVLDDSRSERRGEATSPDIPD